MLWNLTGYSELIGKGLIGVIFRNMEQSSSGEYFNGTSFDASAREELIGGAIEGTNGRGRTTPLFESSPFGNGNGDIDGGGR